MTKKTFYTDRSRVDLHHRCPQARYLAYQWDGTGIKKDTVVWDILVGLCVHEGLSVLLGHYIDSTFNNIDHPIAVLDAVESALRRLDSELSSTPFDLSDLSTESLEPAPSNLFLPAPGKESVDSYLTYLMDETKALIELLIRSYAYAPAGLKWLLDTYEILEVEQEDTFTLVDNEEFEVKFMARADGLLRRRVDGALVVLSFKTTKIYESYKEGAAASDMQGMSEVVALQRRLDEWKSIDAYRSFPNQSPFLTKPETVLPEWWLRDPTTTIEGVQMIYLLTSDSRKDGDGFKRRSSGLLRPWVKRGGGMLGDEYAFTAAWVDGEGKSRRLGKDWGRVNSWELDSGIAGYVDMVKNQFDDALGGYPLDSVIVNSGLHRREKDKLERWERETRAQEMEVARGLVRLEVLNNNSVEDCTAHITNAMDEVFPHHNNACYDFKRPCQFYPICWQSRYYSDDPLSSGFKRRTPHHPIELTGLKKEIKDA